MTAEERMAICRECKISKEDPYYGLVCDRNKWISQDGSKTSNIPIPGYRRGCGCKLSIRTENPNSKCIAGKW